MNIAHRIKEKAALFPDKRSVVHGRSFYTFKEFEERSNQIAHKLKHEGINKGTRTLLFVRPCLDFSVITFALFKIGAIPVLIDPGMGTQNLLRSIKQVRPEALVSVGLVHWIRRFRPSFFASVRTKISLDKVGGSTRWLYEDLASMPRSFEIEEMRDDEHSAILFTSGGTGVPKGVQYTHGILNAQTDALQKMFGLDQRHIDLPGFPLFALFTLAMGMTSIIPDMDPTRPACCDPKKIVKNIIESGATFVAGSPSIWERVGRYCLEQNIQLGSVKQVVMFGAPVRTEIHRMFKKVLPFGDTYTPYGATECLPVSLISGSEILRDKVEGNLIGKGTCIGKGVPGVEIKIIKISDIPESELYEVPTGEVGEIVVCGKQVTPNYFDMEDETKKSKILCSGKLWHRMGDLGHFDGEGNLWFLGRKSHRVVAADTLYCPIQVEAIFNQHPEVRRSALVKLKKGDVIAPGLVIERHDGKTRVSANFLSELKELSKKTSASQAVEDFFLHPSFPVDVRHNIKIDRLGLSAWAQAKGRSLCSGRFSTT
jgi:acyl-CoA synthetase (AMP-forming)/AMP-acid ligase II